VLVPAFFASWTVARIGGWWLGWAAALGIGAFADAPFVALASRLVFADQVRTSAVLRAGLTALPQIAVARMVQALALAISLGMLAVPWIYLGTVMLFVVEVIVLEQSSIGSSLARTQRVAKAHFGAAIVAMILLLLLPPGAALLADAAGREVLQEVFEVRAPPSALRDGGSWLALLGWWSSVPFVATARFFLYLDIRTRTEGWDIQTRFAAIAAHASRNERP
jgi:hypothetical protein